MYIAELSTFLNVPGIHLKMLSFQINFHCSLYFWKGTCIMISEIWVWDLGLLATAVQIVVNVVNK